GALRAVQQAGPVGADQCGAGLPAAPPGVRACPCLAMGAGRAGSADQSGRATATAASGIAAAAPGPSGAGRVAGRPASAVIRSGPPGTAATGTGSQPSRSATGTPHP